ncbi:YqaA family protein [Thalassospira sp.]|uniref:YqaA family protein n=1 Tax=Thalassospira sp. TaxID=1912094 RepID=UPI002737399E|nr:VTT domain-containing protein [Thalassospira sp.]MDP2699613.1 VTT domain-containing protein [Thalassospira sp.]
MEKLAAGRKGLGGLAIASFLETTIIPIPIEIIIAPLMAVSRRRGMVIASVTLLGSVLGAVFLYGLGLGLYDEVVAPLMTMWGAEQQFSEIEQRFAEGGFWLVFVISLTPVPMQLAALAAGVTSYPFWLFLIAITLSRAVRYYGLFALIALFGVGMARIFEGKKLKKADDNSHPV